MSDTGERILLTSLDLFARKGYEATSVSDIAGALGITKGALYRHFESKRAIFDAILARMEQRDGEQARSHDLPEGADSSFFLCKELKPGYLDGVAGVYQTPKGYYVDEKEAEEFDKAFPPKEKLKLPGQLV